eukprot:jgi/Botrbrau1/10505/Bobra.0133s0105.1
MQRAIPSQRGSTGLPQSPDAVPGSIAPSGEPPGEQAGSQSMTSGRIIVNHMDQNPLENEITALKKQLAEQDLKIRLERGELEKREALVRFAAGAAKKDVLLLQDTNKRSSEALQASNQRVKELEGLVAQLTARLQHLELQLSQTQREAQHEAASTDASGALQQEMEKRQAEVASLRADVGRLERALQEAPAVVAEQETRLEALKEELAQVQRERDAHAAEVDRLNTKILQSQEEASQLLTSLAQKEEAREEELRRVKAAYEEVCKEAASLDEQLHVERAGGRNGEVQQYRAAYEAKCKEASRLKEQLMRERSQNDSNAVRQGGRPWWQRFNLQN